MGILAFIVFGFIVGLVARAIMPGPQKLGLVMTTILGVIGSFLGGSAGNLIAGREVFALESAGFIGSVIGALAVMLVVGLVGRRRASHRAVV